MLKFFITIAFICLLTNVYSQDAKKDVQSIVDSITRNSEKPLMGQDTCCPACSAQEAVRVNFDCKDSQALKTLEARAKPEKGNLVLLSGKIFELIDNPKGKKVSIINKENEIRYFTLDTHGKSFNGEIKVEKENEKQKFVREFEKLEAVFSDIKFKELCEYLSSNIQKYSELKAKEKPGSVR